MNDMVFFFFSAEEGLILKLNNQSVKDLFTVDSRYTSGHVITWRKSHKLVITSEKSY